MYAQAGSNLLLSLLPPEEYDRVVADCERIAVRRGEILQEEEEPIDRLYFPTSGVTSTIALAPNGGAIEVALTGNEGMMPTTGLTDFRSAWRVLGQIAGEALAIRADRLRAHAVEHRRLGALLMSYEGAMFKSCALFAACNRFHPVSARTARALLMLSDRTSGEDLTITHQSLAEMLGADRRTVTVVLQRLQSEGMVEAPGRGLLAIADRQQLEGVACDCYERSTQWVSNITASALAL